MAGRKGLWSEWCEHRQAPRSGQVRAGVSEKGLL